MFILLQTSTLEAEAPWFPVEFIVGICGMPASYSMVLKSMAYANTIRNYFMEPNALTIVQLRHL